MPSTYLNLKLSDYVDKEYIPYFEDLIRMLIIQISIHVMMCSNRDDMPLFSFEFLELFLYLIIGVSLYWLLFKKLVKIS
jgi:hypothetical protein